MNSLIE